LRQLGHGDGLPERHLTLYRRRGHLEAVLGFGADRNRARLQSLLLLVPGADIAGDVQLLAAVTRALLIVALLARRRRRVYGMHRMGMGRVRMRLARRLGGGGRGRPPSPPPPPSP